MFTDTNMATLWIFEVIFGKVNVESEIVEMCTEMYNFIEWML